MWKEDFRQRYNELQGSKWEWMKQVQETKESPGWLEPSDQGACYKIRLGQSLDKEFEFYPQWC